MVPSGGETGSAASSSTALASSSGVATGTSSGGGLMRLDSNKPTAGQVQAREHSERNYPNVLLRNLFRIFFDDLDIEFTSRNQVNYNHSFLDKKEFNYSAKKRLESAMSAKITGSISLLAPGTLVEVRYLG